MDEHSNEFDKNLTESASDSQTASEQDMNISETIQPDKNIPAADQQDIYAMNREELYRKESEQKAGRFRVAGPAALIYAVITSICLYKNSCGIMTIFFAAATVGYLYYLISHAPQSRMYENMHVGVYFAGIILLGISVFLTADTFLITWNYIGIGLLSVTVLFRFFCRDTEWGLMRYIGACIKTAFAPIGYLFTGIGDAYNFFKLREKKKSKAIYVAIGIVIALPFLCLAAALLSEADAIFKYIIDKTVGTWSLSDSTFGVILMTCIVFAAAYGVYCYMTAHTLQLAYKNRKTAEPVIGITFCGLLTALYILFSMIQLLSPLLGAQMLPEGYSYAQYARQGFFQLLFVAAMNLIIVLVVSRVFSEHRILRLILTVMCGCTYVMIASSAVRMIMYIQVYHLTYLRILVLFALVNLVCMFAGTIIYLYRKTFPLTRYIILVCGGLYIAFSFMRPDAVIASYNLSCLKQDIQEWFADDVPELEIRIRMIRDTDYLWDLGPDAALAYVDFVQWMQTKNVWDGDLDRWAVITEQMFDDCVSRRGIRAFNLSTYRGKLALERIR